MNAMFIILISLLTVAVIVSVLYFITIYGRMQYVKGQIDAMDNITSDINKIRSDLLNEKM